MTVVPIAAPSVCCGPFGPSTTVVVSRWDRIAPPVSVAPVFPVPARTSVAASENPDDPHT